MDGQILQTLLILSLGAGIFLRLVAKEKHRRERHLQFRLEDQLHKIQQEKEERENLERQLLERQKELQAKGEPERITEAEPALTSSH